MLPLGQERLGCCTERKDRQRIVVLCRAPGPTRVPAALHRALATGHPAAAVASEAVRKMVSGKFEPYPPRPR
jgi:hypothetical protein